MGGKRSRGRLLPATIGLSLVLATLSVGCDGGEVRPGTAISMSYDELVERLSETGASVRAETSTVGQPWSDVPARHVTVDGEVVQVFEYRSATTAETEAGRISPDGTTIGPHRIEWVDPPYFYRADRLVVLYVGRSEAVQRALEAVLGSPFAGTKTP